LNAKAGTGRWVTENREENKDRNLRHGRARQLKRDPANKNTKDPLLGGDVPSFLIRTQARGVPSGEKRKRRAGNQSKRNERARSAALHEGDRLRGKRERRNPEAARTRGGGKLVV